MSFLIYEDVCPECGEGKVIRHIGARNTFCSNGCGILLRVPSWRTPEEKVSTVCLQVGNGHLRKITRRKYMSLSKTIIVAATYISEKYPRLIDVMHALKSGELNRR